jgi:hypothetical protein
LPISEYPFRESLRRRREATAYLTAQWASNSVCLRDKPWVRIRSSVPAWWVRVPIRRVVGLQASQAQDWNSEQPALRQPDQPAAAKLKNLGIERNFFGFLA